MHPTVRDRLQMREVARASGDVNLERACNADLRRYGWVETTEAAGLPEQAVPVKPRRGRPPKPRCEHGKIVGRCVACAEDELGGLNEPAE